MQKVIFIDDDPFFHFLTRKMLHSYNNSTEVVHSIDALSVIDLLKNNLQDEATLPDYIFVDLNMPQFTGWDFLEFYKEISSSILKQIDIYILSSSMNINNINRSKDYSFVSSFITKPLTKKVLEGILRLA